MILREEAEAEGKHYSPRGSAGMMLCPAIQHAIMSGRQPQHLFLEKIQYMPIPLSWKEQRKALGFHDSKTGLSGE